MKYKNKKCMVDGVWFDSMKEAAVYQKLKIMQDAGEIEYLTRQEKFELVPSVILDGRKKPSAKYIADMSYIEGGVRKIVDVKSKITRKLPMYRLKKHMMKHLYNIDIIEI